MHRASYKFVSRVAFGEDNQQAARFSARLMAVAMCAGLAACADDPKYPSVATISDIGTVLTPEERQKALQEMQKQDQAHIAGMVQTASK